MRVVGRLFEIQKMSKYSKYVDGQLIPTLNNKLGLRLTRNISTDPYIITYQATRNEDDEHLYIKLVLTTNKRDNDGLFWGTFVIAGKKFDIGSLIGDLKYDIDIIEDSYYYFFEQHGEEIRK